MPGYRDGRMRDEGLERLFSGVISLTILCVLLQAGMCPAAEMAVQNLTLLNQQSLEALLRPEHPRLLVSSEDFSRVKQLVTENQLAAQWLEKKRGEAQNILLEARIQYDTSQSRSMLAVSRKVLRRVYTLALIYRLDGNQQLLNRLWQDLESAAGFADWHPENFLDTAEMTHAFAIAYDWLYASWSPEQRSILRNAIIEKGLKPALKAYQGGQDYGWWVKTPYNWNQVCNGGVGLGALSVFKEAPELATAVLLETLRSLPLAMGKFSPDGGCYEGTLYWGYATYYNTLLLAAMETALNSSFGLTEMPGYARTGFFPICLTDPQGDTFNFADADGIVYWTTHMFWLARKFQEPLYAWYARQITVVHALDLLWFSAEGQDPQASGFPLNNHFRGVETVTLRSRWDDPSAIFVGFKGGDNKAGHSHLDLGSFVLKAQGVQWAVDLGADDYDLPGYFDNGRWNYYRMRAEGHNTLVINPDRNPDQDPDASAPMIRFRSDPDRAFAITDLSAAYASSVKRVWRGLALLNRQQILVQDEIESDYPVEVWWAMHTQTDVQISEDKRSAVLTQGSSRLSARILAPSGAAFISLKAQPAASSPHPPNQAINTGVSKLSIQLGNVKNLRLSVLLEPLSTGQAVASPTPALTQLADWQ